MNKDFDLPVVDSELDGSEIIYKATDGERFSVLSGESGVKIVEKIKYAAYLESSDSMDRLVLQLSNDDG